MPSVVRDLGRNRVLIPGFITPPLVETECAACGASIEVLVEHVEGVVNSGAEVHALCLECIPDYLKG